MVNKKTLTFVCSASHFGSQKRGVQLALIIQPPEILDEFIKMFGDKQVKVTIECI